MIQLNGFTKYDCRKETDVPWIGNVPNHWALRSNKYIFKQKKNQVGKKSADYDLLSLTLRGIVLRDMDNPEGKFPAEFDTYQEVSLGDFVFCHFDVEETPRTVGLSNYDGMITGAYTVYSVSTDVDPRFILYFYLNADHGKKLRFLYKGLRNTIPKDAFASFKTPLPPLREQQTIAAFLDDKTAKIDQAISIKEQQIALLKERKQIIIQEAVTKGLNPDAPMKDSGIDWIGEIPAHWEGKSLNYVVRLKSGNTISSENFTEQGYPVFGGNGFRGFTNNYTNEGYYALIGRQGALCGNVNYAKGKFFASEHAIVAYPLLPVETLWIGEVIRCANFNRLSQSAAQPGISVEVVSKQRIPYAPYDEQKAIVLKIELETAKIDAAIEVKVKQISALKEYKTSLINEAVTGKIKVV